MWDDEFYYLLAYDEKAAIIKHYRVDKMEHITPAKENRAGREVFEAVDMGSFSQRVFGMYGGEEAAVRMRMHKRLIQVVADRFGSDVMIQLSGKDHFVFTVKVTVSPQFFSWLFGFGAEAQVLAPQSVVDEARRRAEELALLYNREE